MNENLESLINALTEVAQTAANKAKSLTSIAKSNINIMSEQEKLKRAYTELGKLYYRDYVTGEEPDDAEYLPLCDRIAELVQNIQGLRDNIEQAKAKPEKPHEEDPDELREELAELEEELADLEEEFSDLEEERKELEQTREELAAKLADLTVAEEPAPEAPEEAAEEKPEE